MHVATAQAWLVNLTGLGMLAGVTAILLAPSSGAGGIVGVISSGQVALAAIWVALGGGPIVARLVAVGGAIAFWSVCAGRLFGEAPDYAILYVMIAIAVGSVSLIARGLGFAIVSVRAVLPAPAKPQFTLALLIGVVTVSAVVLAVWRHFSRPFDVGYILIAAMIALETAIVSQAGLFVALGGGNFGVRLFILFTAVVIGAILLTMPGSEEWVFQLVLATGQAVHVAGSLALLRAAGFRWIRSGDVVRQTMQSPVSPFE